MIYGIGTDIVAVERFERLLARYGDKVARRILTSREMAQYARAKQPARLLAKRFAAKEAFSKALGVGIRYPATLRSIGVGHDAKGKPCYELSPVLNALLEERNLEAHLSISDESAFAVAFAVLARASSGGTA